MTPVVPAPDLDWISPFGGLDQVDDVDEDAAKVFFAGADSVPRLDANEATDVLPTLKLAGKGIWVFEEELGHFVLDRKGASDVELFPVLLGAMPVDAV